jgi:ADP-heptose:LPS heptosyltransferase
MRILVIRPGALGDVLVTLPALQALSEAFPSASIELMGSLAVVQWLPGRGVVNSVSSFDRADLGALFQPEAVPAAGLRDYLDSFDLIVSYATAPEHVFARNLARLARGRVLSLDTRPSEVHMHMSVYLQQPLRELGAAADAGYPDLHLTPADQQEAGRWWAAQRLEDAWVVAIHPGSGSPAKNWPAERFAALATQLQRERRARIVLLSGPADEIAGASMRRVQDAILLQEPPLALLAAILSRCRLYVGNDSGVSHLAAAVGVPTVAIFGPTDPEVWAPRGPAVRIVREAAPCAPCAPSQRQAWQECVCLEAVSVQMVMDAIAMLGAH